MKLDIKKVWQKIWPSYVLIGVGALLLLLILFRGCNPAPSHKQEKKGLDSSAVAYKSAKDSMQRVIADLKFQNEQLRQSNDTLLHQRDSLRKEVSTGIKKVQGIIQEGREALKRGDSGAVVHNWVALANTAEKGISVIQKADTIDQQLVDNYKAQMAIKDSTISNLEKLWQRADFNYTKAQAAYDGLYKDYGKLNTRFTFNKTLTRIEAAVILAAVVKVFILK